MPMAEMPQLCFGTAQYNLEDALSKALQLGYRHIDGAEAYAGGEIYTPGQYKSIVAKCIRENIPNRHELWITWKEDGPTVGSIIRTIVELGCGYIDLFLIHHSCGTEQDFDVLKKAQAGGLIRYFGVSNCEDFQKIISLKSTHGIYANQIQARPPGGEIQYRGKIDPEFIEKCNSIDVRIMLFATTSGFTETEPKYKKLDKSDEENLNKYYIQKYLRPFNVLMVSSLFGGHLEPNLNAVRTFLSGTPLLKDADMRRIESGLQETLLKYM